MCVSHSLNALLPAHDCDDILLFITSMSVRLCVCVCVCVCCVCVVLFYPLNNVCFFFPRAGRIKAVQLDYSEAKVRLEDATRKAPKGAVGFLQSVRVGV